jgi:hypothetical protein
MLNNFVMQPKRLQTVNFLFVIIRSVRLLLDVPNLYTPTQALVLSLVYLRLTWPQVLANKLKLKIETVYVRIVRRGLQVFLCSCVHDGHNVSLSQFVYR